MLHLTGFGTTIMALFGVPRGGLVPGHEVVGTVIEAGRGARVSEGDRVVLEPTLSCEDKGFPPCPRCVAGDDEACERIADPGTRTMGQGFGHNVAYGGGWAEELVAPARRAFRVPDGVDDRAAVLAEPFAIGVHAVARNLPHAGTRALVIGPGPIGLAVVHALRALAPDTHVTVAGVSPFSDALATDAGANTLIHGTRRSLIEAAAAATGARVRGNRISGLVLDGGFDTVFDAVGSPQTIDDAFRMTRARGTVVLVGTSIKQEVDWTLVWVRELTIRGTAYYGTEHVSTGARLAAGARRGMALALEIIEDRAPGSLVTHVFGLDEAVEALRTSDAGPGAQAVKVAFAP